MTNVRDQHYDVVKRVLDFSSAAVALVVLSPVLAVVAAVVAAKLGRPVLFTQRRPGRAGEIFVLVKFRSMRDTDPARGLVSDEERMTDFGRKLRSTSLDELPTLVNVLTGKMSFVGPRPLLVAYLNRYTPEQARRHEVRPGITGLAQVSGRNSIAWDQKFLLDVSYVDRVSWRLDAWILVQTLFSVLRRDGITTEGHVTAPEFVPLADENGRA